MLERILTYHNLILHGSIAVGRGSGSGGRSGTSISVAGTNKVICHLRVELFGGLLGRAGVTAAALLVGIRGSSLGTTSLGGSGVLLLASGRFGLALGLAM